MQEYEFIFRNVSRIFLTNDLTERVLQEAVENHADLIISYHPPIFAPLKRITQRYAICNSTHISFLIWKHTHKQENIF